MDSLHHAVYQALVSALRLCEMPGRSPALIRRAYTNPAPPPPPESRNALYYHLQPEAGTPWMEEAMDSSGVLQLFRFSRWRLNLVFYGPDAEALASHVHHLIFLDGYGNPRAILRAAGIYPIPRSWGPSLVWEEREKQHRMRTDLSIPLSVAVNWSSAPDCSGKVSHPPEIRMTLSEG